jgi:luciferase family oxidoreductase group 1
MVKSADASTVPLRLSVLDQSPVPEGANGGDALRSSIDLAQLSERLGYGRYWVAEHHGTPALACTSPEVLIGLIGAATLRIRVGSGGVMLPHYSPLKVAETFSMLSALYPGRVDLGIGRAAGTDRATALALQRDRRQPAPDDFPEQLDELLKYLRPDESADERFRRRLVLPGGPHAPQPWLLGSSHQSALWAAERGLPYVFADFINPSGAEIAALYRERFVPSAELAAPRVIVAGWAICADTDEAAQRLAASFQMLFVLMYRGQLIPVPPPEKALAFLREEAGRGLEALSLHRRLIVGTPPAVRAGIESLAAEYQADEVMLVNILYDHAARRRSYELVAEAFQLSSANERASSKPIAART